MTTTIVILSILLIVSILFIYILLSRMIYWINSYDTMVDILKLKDETIQNQTDTIIAYKEMFSKGVVLENNNQSNQN